MPKSRRVRQEEQWKVLLGRLSVSHWLARFDFDRLLNIPLIAKAAADLVVDNMRKTTKRNGEEMLKEGRKGGREKGRKGGRVEGYGGGKC